MFSTSNLANSAFSAAVSEVLFLPEVPERREFADSLITGFRGGASFFTTGFLIAFEFLLTLLIRERLEVLGAIESFVPYFAFLSC